jgi:hypothetical protein
LRRIGDEKDADQIEKNQKLPPDYIDPSYPNDPSFPNEHNRIIFDRKADPAEQLKQWQKEYSQACVEVPYSRRAIAALEELMRISLAEQNWQALADSAVARCKIYEHTSDELAGRSVGCVPPNDVRMDYYSRAARAFIHLGKKEEAQKWLDRAVKILPEMSCLEYITLATLELDCDNPALAAKYAELSENLFTEQYMAVYPYAAANVWKKVGQPARAEAIIARKQKMWDASQSRYEQARHSVFNRTGM